MVTGESVFSLGIIYTHNGYFPKFQLYYDRRILFYIYILNRPPSLVCLSYHDP